MSHVALHMTYINCIPNRIWGDPTVCGETSPICATFNGDSGNRDGGNGCSERFWGLAEHDSLEVTHRCSAAHQDQIRIDATVRVEYDLLKA